MQYKFHAEIDLYMVGKVPVDHKWCMRHDASKQMALHTRTQTIKSKFWRKSLADTCDVIII